MRPSVCPVSLRGHNVNVMVVKSVKKGLIVPEKNDFSLYLMLLQIRLQHTRHCTVEDADLFPVQRRGGDGYILIGVMLNEVICLIAHSRVRIPYDLLTILPPGKTREEIYIAVQKHLVQVSEFAVNIVILPSGILRELLIVLISIARFDSSLPCAFLENLVFIIAYADSNTLVA